MSHWSPDLSGLQCDIWYKAPSQGEGDTVGEVNK